MARMVCVWLPNWSLQRLRHERPKLRGRPVVLFSNAGNREPRVVAWSRGEVGSEGITRDMPLAEAEALLTGRGTTPTHIEPHDPAADVASLRELARTCDEYSPLFGVEEADSPECLLLDVAGCEHLFGGEQNLVDALAADFRNLGFQVRVALAPTIGAAWAAAHCLVKPHVQAVLGEQQLEQMLAPLPVTALRLSPSLIDTLHELGLRRIGQLRELPRKTLPSRFGTELLARLDQAFGDTPELLVALKPVEPIAAVWVTDEPLTDRESLKIVSRQLLDELLGRLKPRREGVRQLLCQIKGAAARPVELVIHLVCPNDVAKHLLELLNLHIDRVPLPEGISFVRLEASSVGSLDTRQRDLFGFEADADTQRDVSSMLDRLSNRLGQNAVVRAVPVAEAQPELAVRHEPWVFAEGRGLRGAGQGNGHRASMSVAQPATRPLRLFQPPQRIDATAAGPEGAPMHFRWDRRDHRVIRAWGPERIETGWWRERAICRDYFRVVTQTGQHFWLFRCFEQSAWFIHGAFD